MDELIRDDTFGLDLLERVNPVFNTAKMTLFSLGTAGDEDALALSEKLALTEGQTQGETVPDETLVSSIIVETRFRTMGRLAEESGYPFEVDLPCGYTPRALKFARKGHAFVGLDLPAAILEAEPAIMSMLSEDERHLVRFFGVDATNYASLKEVFDQITGEVCITTEGLLMYLTDSETGQLCDSIHKILSEHGGCWLLADAETVMQYILTARAFFGDRFMEVMNRRKDHVSKKSDVDVSNHTLVVNPRIDAARAMREAMAFLARHGLKAERLVVADHVPELDSLKMVPEAQAQQIRESMQNYAYWKITPIAAAPLDASEAKSGDLELEASLSGDTLNVKPKGRVDTLTSPNLLTFFEKAAAEHTVSQVRVDCAELDYISSAGLRVLIIMRKKCADGVTLTNVNGTVREVIEQTSLDSILTIEE